MLAVETALWEAAMNSAMNAQTLKRGALAGMGGGVVMAMWSMIVLWLTGTGFWTPLNSRSCHPRSHTPGRTQPPRAATRPAGWCLKGCRDSRR